MKRYWLILVFYILSVYWLSDGFLPKKIYSDLSVRDEWEISNPSNSKIQQILSQKFTYLDKGHQCYVFESEDGQYVLKFINQLRFDHPKWLHSIPSKAVKDWLDLRQNKLEASFRSFKIAMEDLRLETGLIFIQLNRTNHFEEPLLVQDSLFKTYKIDLNSVQFIIQKKATPIYEFLEKNHQQKGKKGFYRSLISLVEIMKARINKQIMDDDLDVEINYGFVGNEAILFDVGRLTKESSLKEKEQKEKELLKSTKYFREWLSEKYPEDLSFFMQLLHP